MMDDELKLWLLVPKARQPAWEPWYDKAFGFIVCAATEEAAREYAQMDGGDEALEGPAWLDSQQSSCDVIGTPVPELIAGVVLRDLHMA